MSGKLRSGPGDILIEIVVVGAQAKVSAIDSATGTEVSIMGPAMAPRAALEAAAARKLAFVMKRKGTS